MRARLGASTAVGLSWTGVATACGTCAMATVDGFLPPVLLWFWLPISWYVVTSLVGSVSGHRFALIPGILGGVGIGIGALFVGSAFMGPLVTLPLLLPPGFAFVRSVFPGKSSWPTRSLRWTLLAVGLAHTAVLGAGVVSGIQTLRTRSEGAYICRWAATGPARGRFKQLADRGLAALPEYRFIVANSRYASLTADAAEQLVKVGTPLVDRPLLQAALARHAGDRDAVRRIAVVLETFR